MTEPLYPTKTVADATGASERQLQWWDEHLLVCPDITKWKRRYSFRQALTVKLVMNLRRKHVTLQQCGEVISLLKDERDLMRAVDSREHILLVGTKTIDVRLVNPHGVLDAMLETEEPVVAVDLRYESAELAEALGS